VRFKDVEEERNKFKVLGGSEQLLSISLSVSLSLSLFLFLLSLSLPSLSPFLSLSTKQISASKQILGSATMNFEGLKHL
jgi:hypothetical protein